MDGLHQAPPLVPMQCALQTLLFGVHFLFTILLALNPRQMYSFLYVLPLSSMRVDHSYCTLSGSLKVSIYGLTFDNCSDELIPHGFFSQNMTLTNVQFSLAMALSWKSSSFWLWHLVYCSSPRGLMSLPCNDTRTQGHHFQWTLHFSPASPMFCFECVVF